MYQFSYAEVLDDDPKDARSHERRALEQAVDMLNAAQAKGSKSREAVEAVFFVRRLWTIFLEDLANNGNDLPEALRAQLISIGLWITRELEAIRLGKSDNFAGIAQICAIIRDGLK
jgi:flagellar protein FlaF